MPNLEYEILHYRDVVNSLGKTCYLLLGNGFSIACDPVFTYGSLYEVAVQAGLSERAQAVFDRLGTNNFEGVMRVLDDAHWIAGEYGLIDSSQPSQLTEDVEVIKAALVSAIANSHLAHSGLLSNERKDSAANFLSRYSGVFTSNYDLLLYWINMFAGDPPPFEDGFRADPDEPDAHYVVFSERIGSAKGIFYLHGGLHLYMANGQLRKHCWSRTGTPLTNLIRTGLEAGNYPLFVAEGRSDKKNEQINKNGYLAYCLGKLGRIASPLVIFGHGLSESDSHINTAIAQAGGISRIFIGLHGNPDSLENQRIITTAESIQQQRLHYYPKKALQINFFSSESANVWGEADVPPL